jgi:hypothetical protein
VTKKQIQIVLTLEIETGDAEVIDVSLDHSALAFQLGGPTKEGVPGPVAMMIQEFAPPSLVRFEMAFAERCATELGLSLQPPTGRRRYVNAFPPKRYGSKRAAVFDTRSGRAEIYCNPNNTKGRKYAEVVTNNDDPFAVKVYLRSKAAVDEALELVRIGMAERES